MKRNSFIGILIISYFVIAVAFAYLQTQLLYEVQYVLFLSLTVLSCILNLYATRVISHRIGVFTAFYATIFFAVPSGFSTIYSIFDLVIQQHFIPFTLWLLNCLTILLSGTVATQLSVKKQRFN